MNLNGKKGDVNWFIVSLIIVVFSLAVIVMILIRFNFNADIDRTACSESALVRASITEKFNLKEVVSLTCKTKRICITTKIAGSGNCDEGLGSKFVTYRVSGNKENKENQIKMILAREMADCWEMLGQGNLKIFNREITDNIYNGKVVVCSRIMVDNTVLETISSISGMNNYLLSHKVPGTDKSYWDYLRNANDADTLQLLNGAPIVGNEAEDKVELTSQKAVFYLESSVSQIGGFVGGVLAGLASTYLIGTIGGVGSKATALLGGGIIAGATLKAMKIGDELFLNYFAKGLDKEAVVSGIFLTDYSSEGFKSFEENNIKFENIP